MSSQSSKSRTAYICKSTQAAAILEKDGLPEGGVGFAVMDSIHGLEFDHIEILFKPITDQEISAVLNWFFCVPLTRGHMDLMDDFVREHDCIVHLEMGDIG